METLLSQYPAYAAELIKEEANKYQQNAEKALKKAASIRNKRPDKEAEALKEEDKANTLLQTAQWLEAASNHLSQIKDIKHIEEIEHLKAALAHDAPNHEAKKIVLKPFGASLSFEKALTGIRVQTHSQKHFDAKSNAWARANFGEIGDLTAKNTGMSATKEVISSAGAAANAVVKIFERMLNDKKEDLGELINQTAPPMPMDKALLYPLYATDEDDEKYQEDYKYIAIRPITPVWQLTAQYQALRKAAANKLAAALNKLKDEHAYQIPSIYTPAVRAQKLNSKPQNNGPLINAIGGMMVQSIFLPPSNTNTNLTTWISHTWKSEADINIEPLIRLAVKRAIEEVDIIKRISYQKHRVSGTDIKGKNAPENMGVRTAWFETGRTCAEEITLLLNDIKIQPNEKIEKKLNQIKNDWHSLQDSAWNVVYHNLQHATLKISDWKAHFNKGFEAGIFGHNPTTDTPLTNTPRRTTKKTQRKTVSGNVSEKLRIFLEVEAMNAGSFAPTLGMIPLTGVWGALHKWFEREAGTIVNAFKVGAKGLRLLDGLSTNEKGYPISPIFASSKTLNSKEIKTLFEKYDTIKAEHINHHIVGPMENCIITQKSHTGRSADIQESIMNEVKMSGKVLIEVDLGDILQTDQIEHIRQVITKSRFNGGFIKSCSLNRDVSKTIYGWYALSAVNIDAQNPLVEMFERIIHSNIALEDKKPPFGFVQAGWQFLDVPETHTIFRNGETFAWKAAEPVWKAVRWLGWNNSASNWWTLDDMESNTNGKAIGVTPA